MCQLCLAVYKGADLLLLALSHLISKLFSDNVRASYTTAAGLSNQRIIYIYIRFKAITSVVKLREREGQGVDPGRSLKGHL